MTPVYRGAEYLRSLVEALDAVQAELQSRQLPVALIESIFVDDAAVDDSVQVLRDLQQSRPWLRIVHLSRNAGQHGATVAGILHSSGDWVATMDEDLQHHPRHLMTMLLHAVAQSHDVVYGAPEGAVHRSSFRNYSSRIYKGSLSWFAGNPVIRRFSSFRMMRGSVVRAACSVSAHDTYFDVVLSWFTGRVDAVPLPMVDVRTVQGAESGYNFKKLLMHGRRMFLSSDIKPLRIASAVGLLALIASIVLGVGTLVLKFVRPDIIELRGWASLMIAISFFGGLSAFLVGVVIEYMSTLVQHTLGKPTFFVVDRRKDALLLPFAKSQ